MPKGLRLGGPYGDRVWVVTPALALLLIKVLREGIEDHANAIARYSTDAKTAAEETWEYLGSEDFQQRVLIMFTSISKLKKEDENSCKRRHTLYETLFENLTSVTECLQAKRIKRPPAWP